MHFSIDVSPARKRASSFGSPTFGLLADEMVDAVGRLSGHVTSIKVAKRHPQQPHRLNLYFRVAPSGWSTPIPFGKGEKGDKGDKGDPGDEGPQGPAGADGAPGSDAQVVFATVAEVRAGAVDGKVISPKVAADALATVVITRADAAIGINFDSLINATITLDANGTLGQPSGGYPGKSGVLTVINASGTASLAAHSSYRMPKGGITIEGGVNAASRIPYMVGDGAVILFPASKWSA